MDDTIMNIWHIINKIIKLSFLFIDLIPLELITTLCIIDTLEQSCILLLTLLLTQIHYHLHGVLQHHLHQTTSHWR